MRNFYKSQEFSLAIGYEYTVLAMSFLYDSNVYGDCCTIQYCHGDRLAQAPLCLFEIVDARTSKYWLVKRGSGQNVFLWPEPFFREFFHDDLSEGDMHAYEDLQKIRSLLETEFTV